MPIVLFDVAVGLFAFKILVQTATIFIFCNLVSCIFYLSRIMKYKQTFVQIIKEHKRFISSWKFWQLKSILVEHSNICYLIISGNREMWSVVLFSFLAAMCPINIYLLTHLLIDSSSIIETTITSAVIAIQMICTIIILTPLASCCKAVHGIEKHLPSIQWKLKSNWLSYKLKYDDWFKNMVFGPKYAITIGPITAITYKAVMEVCFIFF